jgi:flagellar hook assembly protein FlgD
MTKKFRAGGEGGKAGYNQFTWNGITDFGKTVGNGIYVYKIISKGKVIGTGKLVVLE